MRTRPTVVAAMSLLLTVVAVATSFIASGPAVGYTPTQSGSALPVYATPSALAAATVTTLAAGAQAWVSPHGMYAYQPTCPTVCDGSMTCVTAAGVDGGLGCWVRVTGGEVGACSQTAWYVNPGSGSDTAAGTVGAPLASTEELARRMVGCTLTTSVTWTILGNVGTLTTPAIGPSGRLLVTGSPGATVLFTSGSGGLTGAAAQSGNSQGTITDSAVTWSTAGPGGTSLVGYRLDITSGARAGTSTWITADLGSHVAGVGDPELVVTTAPIPYQLTSKVLAAGDRYRVVRLPLVQNIVVGHVSNDHNGEQEHLVFEGLSWDNTPPYGGSESGSVYAGGPQSNDVRFIACAMGNITGKFFSHVCKWGAFSFSQGSADSVQVYGGVIGGDAECLPGAWCYFAQGTIFTPQASWGSQNCIVVYGYMEVGAPVGGGSSGVGCFGAPSDGIVVFPGGVLTSFAGTYPMWGASNGGYGLNANTGSAVTWKTSRPTITGTSGDVLMGTTAKSWSAMATGADVDGARAGPVNAAWALPASGDLSGSYPNPTVTALQGNAVKSAAPSNGNVLTWVSSDSKWEPVAPVVASTTPHPLSYVQQMQNLGRSAADGFDTFGHGYGMQFMVDNAQTCVGAELFWRFSADAGSDALTVYLWDAVSNAQLASATTSLSASGYTTVSWTGVALTKGHKYEVSYYVTNRAYSVWITNSATTGTNTDYPGMSASTPTFDTNLLPLPAGDHVWYYNVNLYATSAATIPTNNAGAGAAAPIGPLFL